MDDLDLSVLHEEEQPQRSPGVKLKPASRYRQNVVYHRWEGSGSPMILVDSGLDAAQLYRPNSVG